MVVLRILWAFLTSRWLWTFIGLALLGAVIWLFGPLVAVGDVEPFAAPRSASRSSPLCSSSGWSG